MSKKMRAKLVISSVTHHPEGAYDTLTMRAVSKEDGYEAGGLDENNTFSAFTPNADLHMTVTNPELIGAYKEGDAFYVDFSPIDE